jgi:hypothetical protein
MKHVKLFESWLGINESRLNMSNLKAFVNNSTWKPMPEDEIEECEDPDAMRESEEAIRRHLSSVPSQIIALQTEWSDDDNDDDDQDPEETSEWMKMGNFPELFYSDDDPESRFADGNMTRVGTVREDYLLGAKKIAEDSSYPTFVFKWRGHTVVLQRDYESTLEYLFMNKKDFIEEVIG